MNQSQRRYGLMRAEQIRDQLMKQIKDASKKAKRSYPCRSVEQTLKLIHAGKIPFGVPRRPIRENGYNRCHDRLPEFSECMGKTPEEINVDEFNKKLEDSERAALSRMEKKYRAITDGVALRDKPGEWLATELDKFAAMDVTI